MAMKKMPKMDKKKGKPPEGKGAEHYIGSKGNSTPKPKSSQKELKSGAGPIGNDKSKKGQVRGGEKMPKMKNPKKPKQKK